MDGQAHEGRGQIGDAAGIALSPAMRLPGLVTKVEAFFPAALSHRL